ncbi:MAG: membrane protein insertion efficiency factor YidD [Actinomycetota bacterium]
MAGWPARIVLLALVGTYRLTLGQVLGGNCRFYPSCSRYSELAIRDLGAVRGLALTLWRVLRCSPLTAGGVDYPPRRNLGRLYDEVIQAGATSRPRSGQPAGAQE